MGREEKHEENKERGGAEEIGEKKGMEGEERERERERERVEREGKLKKDKQKG